MIRKIQRKHVAAVVVLGFAALGASHVPGHHRVLIDLDHHRDASDSTSAQATIYGPNNLLGGMTHADVDLNPRTTEIADEHLVSGMTLSQAGDSATLLERLHAVTGELDSTGAASAASIGANAVPEPATAGVLAALLIPTLIRRRRQQV